MVRNIVCALVLVTALSCSPRLLEHQPQDLNPIEVLEKSHRMYHILFEPIADSLETIRASAYLSGISDASGLHDRLVRPPEEGTEARRIAESEFEKARKRVAGEAIQAALTHIKKALDADPTFPDAYVLLGNLLLEQGMPKKAHEVFARVLSADATRADALAGIGRSYMMLGKLEQARGALIDAVIFDRVNLQAWSSLYRIGEFQGFTIADRDAPDLGFVRETRGRHYDLVIDASLAECPTQAATWIVYASQRAVWRYEGKYKLHTGSTRYSPTYDEDVDCFMALLAAWRVLSERDSVSCESEYLDYLDQVAEDGYLVQHVLFDYICMNQPLAARHFSLELIDDLRDYVKTHVIIPEG